MGHFVRIDVSEGHAPAWSAIGVAMFVVAASGVYIAVQAGSGRGNEVPEPALGLAIFGVVFGLYLAIAPLRHWWPYDGPAKRAVLARVAEQADNEARAKAERAAAWEHSRLAQAELMRITRPFIPRQGWDASAEPEYAGGIIGAGQRLRIAGPRGEAMDSFECIVLGPDEVLYRDNPTLLNEYPTIYQSADARRWPEEFTPMANFPYSPGIYRVQWTAMLTGAAVDLASCTFRIGVASGDYATVKKNLRAELLDRIQGWIGTGYALESRDEEGEGVVAAVLADRPGPPTEAEVEAWANQVETGFIHVQRLHEAGRFCVVPPEDMTEPIDLLRFRLKALADIYRAVEAEPIG